MMSTLEVISKFLNIIRLTMKLHLPIFVVELAILLTFSCEGWEMCSGKNRLGCFRK